MEWTWPQIRAHYETLLSDAKKAGKTQRTIAKAGGRLDREESGRQNYISKIIANRNKGPSVEVFLRAIVGLGIPASEFFAQLERASTPNAAASSRTLHLSDMHLSASDRDALEVGRRLMKAMREGAQTPPLPALSGQKKRLEKRRRKSR